MDFDNNDLDITEGRTEEKKKISYDIMNDLKPKDSPKNNDTNNFPLNSEKPDNNILESQDNIALQTQELPQKITSKEIIDIQDNNQNEDNMADFMNTNGAEISHILKNPNDISQNMTNLDILGMPSNKTNNEVTPQQSNKILDINQDNGLQDQFLDFGKEEKPNQDNQNQDLNFAKNQPETQEQKPEIQNKQENEVVLNFEEPGPPPEISAPKPPVPVQETKPEQGGFDDIFDDVAFKADPAPVEEKKENVVKKVEEKQPEKVDNATPKENKGPERKKSVEYSGDEQYYSPDYYQDTGGYEDEGESNYYQQNYYGGESDYDEDDKDYETYKRDDTVNDNEKKENKKPNDAVDFL